MTKDYRENQLFKLKEDIVYRVVDDEAVILNVVKGEHFSLNKTGTQILKFLEEGKSVQSLLAFQVNKYKEKSELLKTDAICFINELLKNHIIEEV